MILLILDGYHLWYLLNGLNFLILLGGSWIKVHYYHLINF